MDGVLIRPMRADDVPVAERLSAHAFHDLDVAATPRSRTPPELRPPDRATDWVRRTEHFVATDQAGCWVADLDGAMAGFATSLRREGLWVLATYAVRPGLQGRGIGKPLLEAALTHSRGCLRGMLSASSDPRALRRYLLAGFTLHPQMCLTGTVDRSAIPAVSKVREGSPGDVDLLDSVDRRTRGAGHGPDHGFMASTWRLLVSDSTTGSGYAYVDSAGGLALLAATDRRTATRLLWTVLADGPAEQRVSHVTAANDWAVAVGLAARLDVRTEGYLALRGMKPPSPYVHHGAML